MHLPVDGVLKKGMNPKHTASGGSILLDHFPFAPTAPRGLRDHS